VAYWNYWSEAGFNTISHADRGETGIALAVGTRSRMELARDFTVLKPWYRLRSRAAVHPDTGGINGEPSKATLTDGEKTRDEIVRVLAGKLRSIMAAERKNP
jgi:creatinine amidohydrolase